MPARNEGRIVSRELCVDRQRATSPRSQCGEIGMRDRVLLDADEVQTRRWRCMRQMTLRDHREIQRGAEAEFADGECACVLRKALRQPLRLDEHALHFGGAVGRVINVAELSRQRLLAVPLQARRNQRVVRRLPPTPRSSTEQFISHSSSDGASRVLDPLAERPRIQRGLGQPRVPDRENVVAGGDAGTAIADKVPWWERGPPRGRVHLRRCWPRRNDL